MALLKRLFGSSKDAARTASTTAAVGAREADGTQRDRAITSAIDLAEVGKYSEAIALVDEHLQHARDDAALAYARGRVLFEWGRSWEARKWLLSAEALGMHDAKLYEVLGWATFATAGAAEAQAWMGKSADAQPEDWHGHFGLAIALRLQGRIDDAITSFQRALTLSPDNVKCLVNLAECHAATNRIDAAEAYARRAIARDETSILAWTNLGIALTGQDRLDEATSAFERADRLEETSGGDDQHLNLGKCLSDVGRVDEALNLYARRLRTAAFAGAHAHYGYALLTAGRLLEGWDQYEFRWMQEPLLSRRLPLRKPVWSGQDLRGRTILLRAEQGAGDAIQFIRYARYVKALGATVLLQIGNGARELVESFEGVDRTLNAGEPHPDFDYYIHLMSLPGVFGTELSTIPAAVPYLRATTSRIERWAQRIGRDGLLNVGIAWTGDPSHPRNRYRSITFAALAPLASVPGVRFHSLHQGELQAGADAGRLPLNNLGPDLCDFAERAAVMSELDLVITVDTAIAHLAGALGKPVWVMLPTAADWRWMTNRDDSPWYPTMRLFRQQDPGDWTEVVERIGHALQDLVRSRGMSGASFEPKQATARSPSLRLDQDRERPTALQGLSAVAETVVGIVQYFPDEPAGGYGIGRYGEYLQPQIELFARLLNPGTTVMEVGAGVGMHAIAIAAFVGEAGHVFICDRRPLMRMVARQNLAANRVANATLVKGVMETVDDLRLDALDWLKIDEIDDPITVLEGAVDSLWRLRPRLFISAGDESVVRTTAAHARDYGYQCWLAETERFNRVTFNRREPDTLRNSKIWALVCIPEESRIDIGSEGCIKLN